VLFVNAVVGGRQAEAVHALFGVLDEDAAVPVGGGGGAAARSVRNALRNKGMLCWRGR